MPKELIIDDIPTLNRPNVYMRDKDDVMKKIAKIRNDGCQKLQVVSDFDRTLTKQHVDGRQVLSSFGIFFKSSQIPESMKIKEKELFNKFRPMEVDPHLSMEKKVEAMENWMHESNILLRDIEYDPCDIEKLVKVHGTDLRDGAKDLIDKLDAAGIPVLVFSAGLGDVVEAVLNYHEIYSHNVKVISNFLKYDNKKLNGFKNETLIHVFNKNEKMVDKAYFHVLEGRENVILMGDMTGDSTMADGVKNAGSILKIGFLYDHAEQSLPSYMETFDIVLVDDQTMDIPTDILRTLV
ncbi:hypothetical protein PV325_012540 [Microctonus aethiopoides]|uniref:5'-nucleotidase n=1 Tax=Microctonus aethiopoides TaxID=144406 RepID=A0AA39F8I4_9HYME|nr:hypothetical protein PV325_012540 [Microctonus aethiopoides]KAK0098364.1 hypothetical protein PV326_009117 [Microctonus aethiopoides]KAK0164928.1 hypothetical protein PV328_003493 [Microctonus aethiopoides]